MWRIKFNGNKHIEIFFSYICDVKKKKKKCWLIWHGMTRMFLEHTFSMQIGKF